MVDNVIDLLLGDLAVNLGQVLVQVLEEWEWDACWTTLRVCCQDLTYHLHGICDVLSDTQEQAWSLKCQMESAKTLRTNMMQDQNLLQQFLMNSLLIFSLYFQFVVAVIVKSKRQKEKPN